MTAETNQSADLPPKNEANRPGSRRRGVVIVAVLIVVAALSLAGYHYTDMMVSEDKAAFYAHRNAQARAFAESGIHYTAALLADPNNVATKLGGNPWNNPDFFMNQPVVLGGQDQKTLGYFTIIAPAAPDDANNVGGLNYGVTDESSKINVNSIMKIDPTGQTLHDMLVSLPNMTPEIANNIVAWMGGTIGSGFTNYSSQGYRCRYGPLDSIDELLLVQGVTRALLYGTDSNRNGADDDPKDGGLTFDRGWSAYLTVYSREQNQASDGSAYIFLNNTDPNQLYTLLQPEVGDDMAKFILMYVQNGPVNAAGQGQSTLGTALLILSGGGTNSNTPSVPGVLSSSTPNLTKKPSVTLNTMFDLLQPTSVKSQDPVTKKVTTTTYTSPLTDPAQAADLFAKLFAKTTLSSDPEIPARININTASSTVLNALTTPVTSLTPNDVTSIISARAALTPDAMKSPAWLLTAASVPIKTLQGANGKELAKYLTTTTQVYRVQSVGSFGDKGPAIRLEAVIDTNSGRPRILAWRDLSELGKGIP